MLVDVRVGAGHAPPRAPTLGVAWGCAIFRRRMTFPGRPRDSVARPPASGPTGGRLTSLLSTMTPIFGLILIGFVAARLKVMEGAGVRGLVLFVFNFAIPALLLRSVADLHPPDDVAWGFLGAFLGGSLLAYGLGLVVARFGFGRTLADQGIYGMSGSHSNLVMMGIPIVLAAFGPEASLPMLMIIAFPVDHAHADHHRADPAGQGWRRSCPLDSS